MPALLASAAPPAARQLLLRPWVAPLHLRGNMLAHQHFLEDTLQF